SAFTLIKSKKYEDAWCLLDHTDIEMSYLEANFDIAQNDDKYHMIFIRKMIKEYQKLFPYCFFFSRESIIKAEQCSICGKPISLRNPCGHKTGRLYMGGLCLRKVIDMEFKALSIVTDPFDKYTYVQIPNQEYEYGMLEALMTEIDDPYDEFYIETVKVLKPEYKNIGRNTLCPCGSGKKYKRCHLGTTAELMDHHKVHISKPNLRSKNRFVGTFGTWKQK
ncbi:MAG: SEC-C domain-containing protein, partial [Clostridia bacterium]|nr:SEC-C domain-containing protein [Clostridia bacterium]